MWSLLLRCLHLRIHAMNTHLPSDKTKVRTIVQRNGRINIISYPLCQQTRGNEFIPSLNDVCNIQKRFRIFKSPTIPLIYHKSSHKHTVIRSHRSGKESGLRSVSSLWRHQWRSSLFISHGDGVKRGIRVYTSWLLANQKRESELSLG